MVVSEIEKFLSFLLPITNCLQCAMGWTCAVTQCTRWPRTGTDTIRWHIRLLRRQRQGRTTFCTVLCNGSNSQRNSQEIVPQQNPRCGHRAPIFKLCETHTNCELLGYFVCIDCDQLVYTVSHSYIQWATHIFCEFLEYTVNINSELFIYTEINWHEIVTMYL
jgi:hypothetical protein